MERDEVKYVKKRSKNKKNKLKKKWRSRDHSLSETYHVTGGGSSGGASDDESDNNHGSGGGRHHNSSLNNTSFSSSGGKGLVEYSDVSSEELSAPEAGEIEDDQPLVVGDIYTKNLNNRLNSTKLSAAIQSRLKGPMSPAPIIPGSSLGENSLSTPVLDEDYVEDENSDDEISESRKRAKKKKDKKHKKSKKAKKKKKKRPKSPSSDIESISDNDSVFDAAGLTPPLNKSSAYEDDDDEKYLKEVACSISPGKC